jgi:hypothetical protein
MYTKFCLQLADGVKVAVFAQTSVPPTVNILDHIGSNQKQQIKRASSQQLSAALTAERSTQSSNHQPFF